MACVAIFADFVITDEPAKQETLNVQPEEAVEDLEEVGEEANEAVEKIVPDGPDLSRG